MTLAPSNATPSVRTTAPRAPRRCRIPTTSHLLTFDRSIGRILRPDGARNTHEERCRPVFQSRRDRWRSGNGALADMLSPMRFTLAILAALAFTTGGVFMKYADGLQHTWSVVGFVVLFAAGALLQSLAMRGAELGVTYVLVLGLDAALAFGLGVTIFQEAVTVVKLVAVGLVVAGIALLRLL